MRYPRDMATHILLTCSCCHKLSFLLCSFTHQESWLLSLMSRLNAVYLAELGQLDVDSSAQPRAQVGGAGQHVPQTLIPHELPAPLLDQSFYLQ